MYVQSYTNGAFDEIKESFKLVKFVSFHCESSIANTILWSRSTLFPELRVLELSCDGGHIFGHHYDQLNELKIFNVKSKVFRDIMQKNPQIKKLQMVRILLKCIKFISETLHELESLIFDEPFGFYRGQKIQFETIKSVSIKNVYAKIHFKKVENLELIPFPYIDDLKAWLDQIVQYIGSIIGI